ncbi:hypothetical protein G9A89_004082 [Geosiphon pyriformis]|nr:hypothetical protein G9A89_004082 [Geosiphon pyriformis]
MFGGCVLSKQSCFQIPTLKKSKRGSFSSPDLQEQSSETTANRTGLAKSAEKKDPIELDSNLIPTIDG